MTQANPNLTPEKADTTTAEQLSRADALIKEHLSRGSRIFVIGAVLGHAARKIILRLGIRHPEHRFSTLLARANSAGYVTAPQLNASG